MSYVQIVVASLTVSAWRIRNSFMSYHIRSSWDVVVFDDGLSIAEVAKWSRVQRNKPAASWLKNAVVDDMKSVIDSYPTFNINKILETKASKCILPSSWQQRFQQLST